MIIVTLMMTALYLNYKRKGEEKTNTLRYISVAHGFPTFFLTITVYLSRKNLKIVEMLYPSIIIPTIIIICVSNTTDVFYATQDTRNIQLGLVILEQMIFLVLFQTDYMTNLIMR